MKRLRQDVSKANAEYLGREVLDVEEEGLDQHSIDFRFSKTLDIIPLACYGGCLLDSMPMKRNSGKISILKAGTMRLVLEMTNPNSGKSTPTESVPELTLLRTAIPTIDTIRLQKLYNQLWKTMKMSCSENGKNITVEPSVIRLEKPIKPWNPTTFKFEISNQDQIPAAFTLYCLSDNNAMVPLVQHSFLHLIKTKPINKSLKFARQHTLAVTTPEKILMPDDIVQRMKKLAGKNLPASWLMKSTKGLRSLNSSHRKRNISTAHSTKSTEKPELGCSHENISLTK